MIFSINKYRYKFKYSTDVGTLEALRLVKDGLNCVGGLLKFLINSNILNAHTKHHADLEQNEELVDKGRKGKQQKLRDELES